MHNQEHESIWSGEERRMLREAAGQPPQSGGPRFDPTINLGHILTFMGFIITGFAAWTTMDKRVTILEERVEMQKTVDRQQDAAQQLDRQQIKESLVEIKQAVNKLQDRRSGNNIP